MTDLRKTIFLTVFTLLMRLNESQSIAAEDFIDNPQPVSLENCYLVLSNRQRIEFADKKEPPSFVKGQKDGPVVYIEGDLGKLFSYKINDSDQKLYRTQIFAIPIVNRIFSCVYPNYYTLGKDEQGRFNAWTLEYCFYNAASVTITPLELIRKNPVRIRDRDPDTLPWNTYEYAGPDNFRGVQIAASNGTVVVSGYKRDLNIELPGFIYRTLNFDFAGNTFVGAYQVKVNKKTYTWPQPWYYRALLKSVNVNDPLFMTPPKEWQFVPLSSQVDLMDMQVIAQGKVVKMRTKYGQFSYHPVEREILYRSIANIAESSLMSEPNVADLFENSKEQTWKSVMLNGENGKLELKYQEPLFGIFWGHKTKNKPIFSVIRSLSDFIFNKKRFVDETGITVSLQFINNLSSM